MIKDDVFDSPESVGVESVGVGSVGVDSAAFVEWHLVDSIDMVALSKIISL